MLVSPYNSMAYTVVDPVDNPKLIEICVRRISKVAATPRLRAGLVVRRTLLEAVTLCHAQ